MTHTKKQQTSLLDMLVEKTNIEFLMQQNTMDKSSWSEFHYK